MKPPHAFGAPGSACQCDAGGTHPTTGAGWNHGVFPTQMNRLTNDYRLLNPGWYTMFNPGDMINISMNVIV